MANNTSDGELRTFFLENISHESAGCAYSELTNIAKRSVDRLVDDILLPTSKQREERVAREAKLLILDELIDIEDKTFNRWTQKDIAQFFDVVGKKYRALEQLITTHKGDQ